MVDCLEYSLQKENEVPKIIDLVFKKVFHQNYTEFSTFNKKMRSSKEILKDYGIEMEV